MRTRHTVTISAGGVDLAPIEADVTVDESWAPFAQAQFTVPLSDDVAALDPRLDVRIAGQLKREFGDATTVAAFNAEWAGRPVSEFNAEWAGRTVAEFNAAYSTGWNPSIGFRVPVTLDFDLGLRSVSIDHDRREVTFTAASDEAILRDYRLAAALPEGPGGTSVRAAVSYALAKIGATLTTDDYDATVEADSLVWQPGDSAWDYLTPSLQVAGLRLWCDELRRWHLAPTVESTAGALILGGTENVRRAVETIDRGSDIWCDAVVVVYTWTDDLGDSHTEYDIATTEGYSRVLTVEYRRPYPGAGAAQGILDRATARGRVFEIEAVSDYSAYPGRPVVITLHDVPTQTGTTSAVRWRLPDDSMTVGSRGLVDTPLTAWSLAPEGLTWADVPADYSWADYDPADFA